MISPFLSNMESTWVCCHQGAIYLRLTPIVIVGVRHTQRLPKDWMITTAGHPREDLIPRLPRLYSLDCDSVPLSALS